MADLTDDLPPPSALTPVDGRVTEDPLPTGPTTVETGPFSLREPPRGPKALIPGRASPFLEAAVAILREAPAAYAASVAPPGGWYFGYGTRRSQPCYASASDALFASYQEVIGRVYSILRVAQFDAGEPSSPAMLPFTLDWGPGYTAQDV